jgi:tetratricopeptide (TPR) repeat protein
VEAGLITTENDTMKLRTKIFALAAAGSLVCAIVLWRVASREEPIPGLLPRSDRSGGQGEFLNAQRAAGYYSEEIRKHPTVPQNYVRLAQLFQQEARVTGRHHEYIPKAIGLLDRALEAAPDDFDATVTKASILMTLHRFEEARALAGQAIARNRHNAFAYGVLCDALVELGSYDMAVKICDTMLSIRPDIRSYARASYLREIHGDLAGARAAMEAAADAGAYGQENRAWALYTLGTLFLESGKPDTAEYIFKGILEERTDYPYALSGMARAEYYRGNTDDALRLLTRAAEITPDHVYLEQIADIQRSAGKIREAEGVAKIVMASFEQHEKDGWNVDREYALFCANHGINAAESLRRARRDYERRSDNIDALDTYAWVLYRNGDAAAAAPLIGRALRLNTKNPDIHFHAAMIYRALGDNALAHAQLGAAISGGSAVNPLYAAGLRGDASHDLAFSER